MPERARRLPGNVGPENARFRDVMDILLVEDLIRNDVGLARAREACVDIFSGRSKHSWPPTLIVYDTWRVPFQALARQNGFEPEDIEKAADELRTLVTDIDRSG